jgi:hypothetical protein
MRLAYSSFGDDAAPYDRPILRSVSQSSGKLNLYFSAKRALALSSSKLAPRISAFLAAN